MIIKISDSDQTMVFGCLVLVFIEVKGKLLAPSSNTHMQHTGQFCELLLLGKDCTFM